MTPVGSVRVERREKRIKWLMDRAEQYNLLNYNWGLSHQEINNKCFSIVLDMRREGLFSENTRDTDTRINNLIRAAVRRLRLESRTRNNSNNNKRN